MCWRKGSARSRCWRVRSARAWPTRRTTCRSSPALGSWPPVGTAPASTIDCRASASQSSGPRYGMWRRTMSQVSPSSSMRTWDRRDGIATITRDELASSLDAGNVVVLDVRPLPEYEAGHIPSAVPIDPERLYDQLRKVPRRRRGRGVLPRALLRLRLRGHSFARVAGRPRPEARRGLSGVAPRRTAHRNRVAVDRRGVNLPLVALDAQAEGSSSPRRRRRRTRCPRGRP